MFDDGFGAFLVMILIVFALGMVAGKFTAGVEIAQQVKCVSHSSETGACVEYEIKGVTDGR